MKHACCLVAVLLSAGAQGAVIVEFSDRGLEERVRDTIDKPTGDILDTDLLYLTYLDARESAISDLTGLEYCVNLLHLNLRHNHVRDLQPIARLTKLDSCYLTRNGLGDEDLAALADLQGLAELDLSGNQITDMSVLGGLTNLAHLYLAQNEISDMSPAANLPRLRSLDLSWNKISDISAVASLPLLSWLALSGNEISDIFPVAELVEPRHLDLAWNQISDISAIANLTRLTRLDLGGNQITDISPVAGLTYLLEELYLDNNAIVSIEPVTGLHGLRTLSLFSNQIADLGPAAANPGLGSGDLVVVTYNPLAESAFCVDIPALVERGVFVIFIGACSSGEGEGEGEEPVACGGAEPVRPHSADQDGNWSISLPELMRVIQFYNSDGYHIDPVSEDGYAAGPGETAASGRHDSDYDAADWRISLSEMLRLTQFYHAKSYAVAVYPTEDGYEANPSPMQEVMTLARAVTQGGICEAGQTVEVTLTLNYDGLERITALAVYELLPEGWTLDGWVSGAIPNIVLGQSDLLQMAWIFVPAMPVTLTYRAKAPAVPVGCQDIRGQVVYRTSGGELRSQATVTAVEVVAPTQ
ncbi:MAG: leucine-rich repeat domain-containing protein [Candidatus Hydrogenedentes bacterium]|nr:leucine-rich repeat domain-containing protein [Candidatus Hydrogenedentota bacterium]